MADSILTATPSASARPFWRFGLISGAFLLCWMIGATFGLGGDSPLDNALCHQLAVGSTWALRLLGWQASVSATTPNLLLLQGQPAVIVGGPCDGLVLYTLLVGFVLAYPGPARRRLWFIPMGIVVLWLLNVFRIVALALNHRYSPDTFDFNHHYAFSAVAYSVLGGLWLLWTRQSLPVATVPARPGATQPWLTGRLAAGGGLLLALVLLEVFKEQAIARLSAAWAAGLATGPGWLHRLPGAAAGEVPSAMSHLPLPVGVAYLTIFLTFSLLGLALVLPGRSWATVWRCYVGMALACGLLALAGRVGGLPAAYRLFRMVLDFMTSLLPVAGLLVLLWRPLAAPAPAPAAD
ncbi:MAG TPA: hypothetical protein VFO93_14980 [Hymenobacter sp.]|uniref:exosortase X n=1 Tax=Hymenobacter sp. TaxID=1898978 RepID=UPI002D7EA6C9|nr:hypothetical protein [Hymenobacter sp.]HET9504845.1 hypothetical protein [Hymenobacter sp.]